MVFLSAATELVSELIRAANTVETLSPDRVVGLLNRAISMIHEIRGRVGIIPIPNKDALVYVRTVAVGADRVPQEEWHHSLLHAAEMVRDLHVVADSGTIITIRSN